MELWSSVVSRISAAYLQIRPRNAGVRNYSNGSSYVAVSKLMRKDNELIHSLVDSVPEARRSDCRDEASMCDGCEDRQTEQGQS